MHNRQREGLLYGLIAYSWWGLVPLYFRLLADRLDAFDILAHRVLWSMVFLAGVLTLSRGWGKARAALRQRRISLVLAGTSVLIALNWLFYILAVVREKVVQASLGYFITPLVSVGLGMIFFRERLRRLQWLALALAACGVLGLTWLGGEWPWIAIVLALSFSFYGLLRKRIPVDGLVGLSAETLFLVPAALGYFLFLGLSYPAEVNLVDPGFGILILLSGVVTAVPLLCFGQAAQRLPLSTLGFMQYLSPSVQFLLAVGVFREPLNVNQLYCFLFIWGGLALFSIDSFRVFQHKRKLDNQQAQELEPPPFNSSLISQRSNPSP